MFAIKLGFSPNVGKEAKIVPLPAMEGESFQSSDTLPNSEKPRVSGAIIFVILAGVFTLFAITSIGFLLFSEKKEKEVVIAVSARKGTLEDLKSRIIVFYSMNGRLPEPRSSDFAKLLKGVEPVIDFDPLVYQYEITDAESAGFRLNCKLEKDFTGESGETDYTIEQKLAPKSQ